MKYTQKFLEKRKFVMALPVLVMPFITIMFWALGGGSGTPAASIETGLSGLNLDLPPAHFSEEQLDKLSLYETARRDSLKFQEARDNDPYFKLDNLESPLAGQTGKADPNETMVRNKLDELYRELSRREGHQKMTSHESVPSIATHESRAEVSAEPSADLKQLGQMMETIHSRRASSPDVEGERINSMLDKILDVQHPERVREKLKERSNQDHGQVFGVTQAQNEGRADENAFYALEEFDLKKDSAGNAFAAVVHNTQELVAGSTVKMRLLDDVYVNGVLIPKDEFLYGVAGINGERLTVAITSIRNENSLLPVSLAAYDLDGQEGIYVPGAITRDAAKQSSDQAMQSMQFMTMDQSLSAQAGAAGIQAAKGLFSKKVKLVRVTVKAGYKILLRDGKVNR